MVPRLVWKLRCVHCIMPSSVNGSVQTIGWWNCHNQTERLKRKNWWERAGNVIQVEFATLLKWHCWRHFCTQCENAIEMKTLSIVWSAQNKWYECLCHNQRSNSSSSNSWTKCSAFVSLSIGEYGPIQNETWIFNNAPIWLENVANRKLATQTQQMKLVLHLLNFNAACFWISLYVRCSRFVFQCFSFFMIHGSGCSHSGCYDYVCCVHSMHNVRQTKTHTHTNNK